MHNTQLLPDSPPRHASVPVPPAPFTCSWTNGGEDAAWVRLSGELDIATSPHLERTLSEAQGQARLVVVDLRQVAFADSSALHALVDANTRAQRECHRLVILRGPPQVDRIFGVSGVCDAIEMVDLDAIEPPVMALLRLAADEQGMASADAGERLQKTG